MALNPCLKQILCALSGAVLGALQSIINTQVAVLNEQVAQLKAQLLVVDVAAFPVEVARSAALAVLNQARSVSSLVPVELVAGCLDLGEFNVSLVGSIDTATAEVNDLVDDLNRLLSYKEELTALIAEYEAIIDQFTAVRGAIQECGAA